MTPEQRYNSWYAGDGRSPTSHLGYFAEDLEPEMVKIAISKGADVNQANYNGRRIRHPTARPLMRAAQMWTMMLGNPVMSKRGEETVKELLKAGADPNLSGPRGGAPTIASDPYLAKNPGLQKLFAMRVGKLRGLYIEKALGPSPLPTDIIRKIAEIETGVMPKRKLSPETLAKFKELGIAPKKTAGRRFTRKQCKKFKCAKMGFTQKASCRPYKNCYKPKKNTMKSRK